MKKLLFCICCLVSLATFAAGWKTITGNGEIKKENREAANYTGISLAGNINVEISYGNSKNITIEADENLLPHIETRVENGNLVIKTKTGYNLKTRTKMMVYVSATKLTSAHLSGSGNISGKSSFTNSEETTIALSGSGNIQLAFDKLDKINIKVSGSGNVLLKGSQAGIIAAQISGSGNVDCSTIKASDVNAQISGSGNIRVYATQSIEAKVAGSGNAYYKGEAARINSKTSGSGKVIKA